MALILEKQDNKTPLCFNEFLSREHITEYQKFNMNSTMKALIKEKPEKGYELKEISVPTIAPDEILFEVEKVAICGSDIALYLWNEIAKVIGKLPFIPGTFISRSV